MPVREPTLDGLRARMDAHNRELVALLNLRTETALHIARWKRANGEPMRDARRERAILQAIARANEGPLPSASLQRLFTALLKETVALMEREPAEAPPPRPTLELEP